MDLRWVWELRMMAASADPTASVTHALAHERRLNYQPSRMQRLRV
ncbi:hypothetical protein [Acinetobacter baumannii]|nr:hypothetical protein [Acinetobacter baumannii]